MRCIAWGFPLITACGPGRTVLQAKGSDTVVNLMARLSEAHLAREPGVVVAVNGGGSGTGISALIDGTTDLATASRAMKARERALAADRGVDVVELPFAADGLAVYVHADNPVPALTFAQLACIYGDGGGCDRWSDLGVALDCGGADTIIKLNRQNNSGTYEHFKEVVLGHAGRFTRTLDQSGTQQVADVIASTPCAIGYGGMGYAGGGGVRAVCLAERDPAACRAPDPETVRAGDYPFSRPLYLYADGPPGGPLAGFVDFVLGEEGQRVVIDAGFVPRPGAGEGP